VTKASPTTDERPRHAHAHGATRARAARLGGGVRVWLPAAPFQLVYVSIPKLSI